MGTRSRIGFKALVIIAFVTFASELKSTTRPEARYLRPPQAHYHDAGQPSSITVNPFWTPRDHSTAYSGMWWMSTDNFLRIDVRAIGHLEGASFNAFRVSNLTMTKDWLDFAVEHQSMYIKFFASSFNRERSGQSFRTLLHMHRRYVYERQTRAYNNKSSAAQSTIALLPYFAGESTLTVDNYRDENYLPKTPREKKEILVMYGIAATLASLQQIGIGRAIILGQVDNEPALVTAAMEHARLSAVNTVMDMAYARGVSDEIMEPLQPKEKPNVPKGALETLQHAFNGDLGTEDQAQILGSNARQRWKYVYFTEPDLVLHSRPSMLQPLTEQLDQGNILAAYRLNLLPHESDFEDFFAPSRLVPNAGNLTVTKLHPSIDACCDQGVELSAREPKCGTWWWSCGLGRAGERLTEEERIQRNFRFEKYPLHRLESGLGATFVHEHVRTCQRMEPGQCESTWRSEV